MRFQHRLAGERLRKVGGGRCDVRVLARGAGCALAAATDGGLERAASRAKESVMRRILLMPVLIGALVAIFGSGTASAHVPFCQESVNPHGQNTPPAGSTTLPG